MSPDEEWKKAMKGGQAAAVRDLIEQGADVNAKSPDSVRGGHAAAFMCSCVFHQKLNQ